VARRFAGIVLAAAEASVLPQKTIEQLVIFFGVTSTKMVLGLDRAPNGYMASQMPEALIEFYSARRQADLLKQAAMHGAAAAETMNHTMIDNSAPVPRKEAAETSNDVAAKTSNDVAAKTSNDVTAKTSNDVEKVSRSEFSTEPIRPPRLQTKTESTISESRDLDSEDSLQALMPTFEYQDGTIPITERRAAVKAVKELTHPDGPL